MFDLDGTLIDSVPDVAGALNRLLRVDGRRDLTLAEVRTMIGEGAGAMIERAYAATGTATPVMAIPSLVDRYLAFYRRFPAVETVPFPGVIDVIERFQAAGIVMGICSNKPHTMCAPVLEALGLDSYFAAVIGGGVLPASKPDPGHIAAVLAKMKVSSADAVYVGDSSTDVEAARRAALPVIVVRYGYSRVPPESLGADLVIDRFDELPDAIASSLGAPA